MTPYNELARRESCIEHLAQLGVTGSISIVPRLPHSADGLREVSPEIIPDSRPYEGQKPEERSSHIEKRQTKNLKAHIPHEIVVFPTSGAPPNS